MASWDQEYAASIKVELERLRPLGDFVLVEEVETRSEMIIDPKAMALTRDYRFVDNRRRGLRTGRVLAIGAGDKLPNCLVHCSMCTKQFWLYEPAGNDTCKDCGSDLLYLDQYTPERRAPMHVSPGDVVVYPHVPANDVILNEKPYTLLHEESQVLAVLEA